jgi:hypothetical protein
MCLILKIGWADIKGIYESMAVLLAMLQNWHAGPLVGIVQQHPPQRLLIGDALVGSAGGALRVRNA